MYRCGWFVCHRWEVRFDPNGRVYYVDHNTRTTTWQRPSVNLINDLEQFQQWRSHRQMNQMPDRFLFPQPTTASDDPLGPLPLGWGTLVLPFRSAQPCVPPGSLNWVPAFCWAKGRNVTSAVWQVTLCNPIWHVEFPYPCGDLASCYIQVTYFTFKLLTGFPLVLKYCENWLTLL